MMIRLFGHYVSKLFLLLGIVEFLVMFYSMMAGFYMRFSTGSRVVEIPESLSYTAMASRWVCTSAVCRSVPACWRASVSAS